LGKIALYKIQEKTEAWAEAVTELASVAPKYPQTSYSGLQKLLQQEWQSMQRVTTGIGPEFKEVERALAKTFLPALFGDSYDGNTVPWRQFACLPVKWAGLAIPDPTSSAELNHDASELLTFHALAAFRGVNGFLSADHPNKSNPKCQSGTQAS
jgi:hypothetical protein